MKQRVFLPLGFKLVISFFIFLKIDVNHNIFYLGKILNFTLSKILKIFLKKL